MSLAEISGRDGFIARRYDHEFARVLELQGECDISTSEDLRTALTAVLADRPTTLVVDLTRLEFCDAGCAGQLIDAAADTTLAVTGATGVVRRVFEILDPTEILLRLRTIHDAVPGSDGHG